MVEEQDGGGTAAQCPVEELVDTIEAAWRGTLEEPRGEAATALEELVRRYEAAVLLYMDDECRTREETEEIISSYCLDERLT